MTLAFLMWISSLLPQPVADPLCLATTVYLEARDQPKLGQRAVAEVALRRRADGRWGDSTCAVVNAPKQFAPTIVNPNQRLVNLQAWQRAVDIAFEEEKDWSGSRADRHEVVPGASHFAALDLAQPSWSSYPTVAKIGDHTFYRVDRLAH